jgi:hypothetical protein
MIKPLKLCIAYPPCATCDLSTGIDLDSAKNECRLPGRIAVERDIHIHNHRVRFGSWLHFSLGTIVDGRAQDFLPDGRRLDADTR